MKEIKQKPAGGKPKTADAARVPKAVVKAAWLQAREAARAGEKQVVGGKDGAYSGAADTGEKGADKLVSTGERVTELAYRGGRKLAERSAGQRRERAKAAQTGGEAAQRHGAGETIAHTAIDEYTRLSYLGAYPEQSAHSSADFLEKMVTWFKRRGVRDGIEFTNHFSTNKKDRLTRIELAAARLGIRHKLICPYTPHHNGKVERSHREDQKRFYNTHRFFSFADFGVQFAAHQNRSNDLPMRPLGWLSPKEKLAAFFDSLTVQDI